MQLRKDCTQEANKMADENTNAGMACYRIVATRDGAFGENDGSSMVDGGRPAGAEGIYGVGWAIMFSTTATEARCVTQEHTKHKEACTCWHPSTAARQRDDPTCVHRRTRSQTQIEKRSSGAGET